MFINNNKIFTKDGKEREEIKKEVYEIFSTILKKEIKDKKLSLINLCNEYKSEKNPCIIEKTIENYYYRTRKNIEPEINTLFQLSKLFHTNIEYFLGKNKNKNEYISDEISFKKFSKNLKQLIKDRKITTRKLSKKLKISERTLHSYKKIADEQEERSYKISIINMIKISEYFKVSISELFDLKMK